jgi:hypothetical protein
MENEFNNILIEKTLIFCQRNVHDWGTFNEEKKDWYLKKVARLLLDDKDVLKEMFKEQLN